MRPLLVGECNPYGGRPMFALYPYPDRSSGARLAHILGLTRKNYLLRFERTNLCVDRWSIRAARLAADSILAKRPVCPIEVTPIILLGSKVCQAFGVAYEPFCGIRNFRMLPHPSGRNRIWNDPRAAERARALLEEWLK